MTYSIQFFFSFLSTRCCCCCFDISSFFMFCRNEKNKFRRNLWWKFIIITIVENFTFFVAIRWFVLYYNIKQQKYLTIWNISISKCNWIIAIFFELNERRFRKFVRINRIIFEKMFCIVENDFVFHFIENNNVQIFVRYQLIIALHKFDYHETNENVQNIVVLWKIFEKHIINCIKRVIFAFYKKKTNTFNNQMFKNDDSKTWKITRVQIFSIVWIKQTTLTSFWIKNSIINTTTNIFSIEKNVTLWIY